MTMQELEVHEIRYGFIPDGTDHAAYRVRRRFRLVKGGHPQLQLIHYSRGQAVRACCLPPISCTHSLI
jgi:hypothetical protein